MKNKSRQGAYRVRVRVSSLEIKVCSPYTMLSHITYALAIQQFFIAPLTILRVPPMQKFL